MLVRFIMSFVFLHLFLLKNVNCAKAGILTLLYPLISSKSPGPDQRVGDAQ